MKTYNANVNTARAIGNNGVDYIAASTTKADKEYYGFSINTVGTVTAVTIKDADGTTSTETPTWLNVDLAAGAWIPAGLTHQGKQGFITSITTGTATILAYRDNKP